MSGDIQVLAWAAVTIGIFHTLLGPDHYLPFIMMSRAQGWSMLKTLTITLVCGVGHVLSSVFIGTIGLAAGMALFQLEGLESFRGNLAAWALIAVGGVYFIWGLKQAFKNRPHVHAHQHEDGATHAHVHNHRAEHAHAHLEAESRTMTPWVLFTVFVLGPCEALIPILMYPAAKASLIGMVLVISLFSLATVATMTCVVLLGSWGFRFIPLGPMERFTHALAGLAICMSGLAIQLLGI